MVFYICKFSDRLAWIFKSFCSLTFFHNWLYFTSVSRPPVTTLVFWSGKVVKQRTHSFSEFNISSFIVNLYKHKSECEKRERFISDNENNEFHKYRKTPVLYRLSHIPTTKSISPPKKVYKLSSTLIVVSHRCTIKYGI